MRTVSGVHFVFGCSPLCVLVWLFCSLFSFAHPNALTQSTFLH